MNSKDILLMVQSLSNEKGVSSEAIFQAIESAWPLSRRDVMAMKMFIFALPLTAKLGL